MANSTVMSLTVYNKMLSSCRVYLYSSLIWWISSAKRSSSHCSIIALGVDKVECQPRTYADGDGVMALLDLTEPCLEAI